ncbi:hypothetical protein [Thermogemmatispora onikobensis]|uniref:hypothetical protein n=1 Tax=Thermogemmatispora onikobensis TaxID=732234 RepID=UPI0008529C70|nr:hypothetical protein [Thermogemmatispora onikobensis]
MQEASNADDERVREERLHVERPDAGAGPHIQDGAGPWGKRGQVMVAQGPRQRVMLVVESLVFQRVLGQEIGHVFQRAALGSRVRSASFGGGVGGGWRRRSRRQARAVATKQRAYKGPLSAPFFLPSSSCHTAEHAHEDQHQNRNQDEKHAPSKGLG